MRNILFLVISVFFIVGCSFRSVPKNGKEIEIVNGERIYTKSGSLSATAPNNFPKTPFEGYTRFDHDLINFERHIPNMMSEDVKITVKTVPTEEKGMYGLLNKDSLEKRLQEPPSEWAKKNLAERGVKYSKWYVDYIGGLKCSTNVEKANLALGVTNAKYGTYCAYYDTSGGRKEIDISYRYTYSHNGTKYDSDNKSSSVTPEAMQLQFKQDIKAIFDSLMILDMDRERMSKEGLLHNRKYDIESEFR